MMPRRRQARIRITYEMLHDMLCLEDSVYLENVAVDPYRKIVDFVISSENDVLPDSNRTFERGEGQEIIINSLEFDSAMVERMRGMVQNWDERQQNNEDRQQSQEAMNALYEQMRSNQE